MLPLQEVPLFRGDLGGIIPLGGLGGTAPWGDNGGPEDRGSLWSYSLRVLLVASNEP